MMSQRNAHDRADPILRIGRLSEQLQVLDELSNRDLHEVPKDQAAKRMALCLPVLRQGLESDVMSDEGTSQPTCMFQKQFIREAICPVFLRSQDIDLAKSQLTRNGAIDVDIEVERDGHVTPNVK